MAFLKEEQKNNKKMIKFKVGDRISYQSTKGEKEASSGVVQKIYPTTFGGKAKGTGIQLLLDNERKGRKITTVNAEYCTIEGEKKTLNESIPAKKTATVIAKDNKTEIDKPESQFVWVEEGKKAEEPNRNIKISNQGDLLEYKKIEKFLGEHQNVMHELIKGWKAGMTIVLEDKEKKDRMYVAEFGGILKHLDKLALKEGKKVNHTPEDGFKHLIDYFRDNSVGYDMHRSEYFQKPEVKHKMEELTAE
jgi:hypothetical protein